MNLTAARPKIMVSADGKGLVSQAGAVLLAQAMQVTGLDRGLREALGRWRAPRAVHDPGRRGPRPGSGPGPWPGMPRRARTAAWSPSTWTRRW